MILRQVNATSGDAGDRALAHGWFMRLNEAGEKALGTSLIFRNVLYFTTYIPTPHLGACGVAIESSYAYAVSVIDGTPVLDFNNDGKVESSWNTDGETSAEDDVRHELKHQGPPPNPTLFFPENQDPEIFIGTEKLPTDISSGTGRTY